MCGIQESLFSTVTPKNLADDTSMIGVYSNNFFILLLLITYGMLVKVYIFIISGVAFSCRVKCINSIFPGLYIEEDTFHEFIYFNQYIVCFFNKNMPIAPSNKNVCIKH